jgi:hypothetical protein
MIIKQIGDSNYQQSRVSVACNYLLTFNELGISTIFYHALCPIPKLYECIYWLGLVNKEFEGV